MKYKLTSVAFLLFILILHSEQANVSVLKFKGKGVSDIEAEGISDLFSVGLVKTENFKVLDRANMEQILNEQSFQQSGCTDSACAVQIGKLLNMDFMFTGSVIKLGNKMYMTVNKIAVQSGQIIISEESQGFTFDTVKQEIDKLVVKMSSLKEDPFKSVSSGNKSGGEKNKAKPVFIISGLAAGLTGGIMNISALAYNSEVQKAADDYDNADSDFDNLWQEYQDTRQTQKTRYIFTFSSYGLGAALLTIGMIIPQERTVSVIPYLQKDKTGIAMSYSF